MRCRIRNTRETEIPLRKVAEVAETLGPRFHLLRGFEELCGRIPPAGEELLASTIGHLEGVALAAGYNRLVRQAYLDRCRRLLLDGCHQRLGHFLRDLAAGHSDGHAVADEDLGEAFADDHLDAPAVDGLGRVLARRTAAEVLVH